jgi:hypothetical protein
MQRCKEYGDGIGQINVELGECVRDCIGHLAGFGIDMMPWCRPASLPSIAHTSSFSLLHALVC